MIRFDATACARLRCFKCNLRMENMISFGEVACLWSLRIIQKLRGYTVCLQSASSRTISWLLISVYLFIMYVCYIETDRRHQWRRQTSSWKRPARKRSLYVKFHLQFSRVKKLKSKGHYDTYESVYGWIPCTLLPFRVTLSGWIWLPHRSSQVLSHGASLDSLLVPGGGRHCVGETVLGPCGQVAQLHKATSEPGMALGQVGHRWCWW